MELTSLRKHESHLIQFLLNGIADENEQVRADSLAFLEEHGAKMRSALQALGEEDE